MFHIETYEGKFPPCVGCEGYCSVLTSWVACHVYFDFLHDRYSVLPITGATQEIFACRIWRKSKIKVTEVPKNWAFNSIQF